MPSRDRCGKQIGRVWNPAPTKSHCLPSAVRFYLETHHVCFGVNIMFKFKKSKQKIDLDNLPKHIAIIMDGNGRWAKKRGLPRSMGHRQGAKTLERVLDYANNIGIKYLTVYAFSTENWKRPQAEVDALMELVCEYLGNYDKLLGGRNVVLKIIGTREGLSEKVLKLIDEAEEKSKNNTGATLYIALNYGGREEIVHAAKALAKDVADGKVNADDIDEEMLSSYMYTQGVPDPDFIIRPSGELRLSNFLLWQCAYSEFWFSDICWPDFTEDKLEKAIIDFQSRNRRYGGV